MTKQRLNSFNPMLCLSSSALSKVLTENSISTCHSVGFCLSHTLSVLLFVLNCWCQSQPRMARTQEEGCHLQKESQMVVGILCLFSFLPFPLPIQADVLTFWFHAQEMLMITLYQFCQRGKWQQFVCVYRHSAGLICMHKEITHLQFLNLEQEDLFCWVWELAQRVWVY